MNVLVDGQAQATIDADSRGLAYGDGVFRTLRVHAGAPLFVEDHLRALQRDAARLDLDLPSDGHWLADSATLAAGHADAVLKWMLVRRSGARGYRATTRASQRIVQCSALPARGARAAAALCSFRLATQPALAGIKHLNRLEQVLAARELVDGIDELLMCDHDGHLVGGLRSNLFWLRDDRLLTPQIDRCGVAGTMRDRVLRIAASLGIASTEVREPASSLATADEIFVTNALLGIWPLHRLDGRVLAAPGPLTAGLARELGPPFSI